MDDLVAAIEIARKKIEELKKHPRNPRRHPEPGSALWVILKRSLQHAYFEPLVWNRRNGYLVSGHLRLAVLMELGFTLVDVSVIDVDETTHCALMIAANRLLGQWEEEMLALLAKDIDAAGIDAALALYDHKSLLALVDCPDIPDDVAEIEALVSAADKLQEKWRVAPGEMYRLGNHRLLCGECEAPGNWQRLCGDIKADMLWCDPPYNIAYDRAKKKNNTPSTHSDKLLNDDLPRTEYLDLLKAWLGMGAARLKPGGAFYVAHAEAFGLETRLVLRDVGLSVRQCLIWVKQAWTLTRQDYQWQHEPILYGWQSGGPHHWQGGFSQSTVIDFDVELKKLSKAALLSMVNHLRNAVETTVIREPRPSVSELHPTMKPTRLVARHIWNSTRRGEMVIDLHNGSGTTIAAAEQTGRICRATELDPRYVSVTLERMSALGLEIEKVHDCD